MWETRIQSLGREDLLEKEMATHSSILAWKIPWTEETGRLQSMGSQSWTRLSDFTFFLSPLSETYLSSHSITKGKTPVLQAPLSMGILQARILEWVAMASSRGSSQPRDRTQASCIAGGFFTNWTSREAHSKIKRKKFFLVTRILRIYSLNFHLWHTAIFIIFIMLYIISLVHTYNWKSVPFDCLHVILPFSTLLPLVNTNLIFFSVSFVFDV